MDVVAGLMKEMGLIDLYPDMIVHVVLIKEFFVAGRLEDASGLFKVMKGHRCSTEHWAFCIRESCGCAPNCVTINKLIKGLCTDGCLEEAYKLIDKFVAGGRDSNGVMVERGIQLKAPHVDNIVETFEKFWRKRACFTYYYDDESKTSFNLTLRFFFDNFEQVEGSLTGEIFCPVLEYAMA
ncbi:hypothetical protein F0562_007863 [Nyssa sinensis]|uniref:Pentatricopeptide repeat-containing protein n=1 Tax=Nyssa sinensis TaxID=561372 RepID=A0A5J5A9F8_9ASTE|nr:hypothetical protein F0562_007863 [Nyssa sinensis]